MVEGSPSWVRQHCLVFSAPPAERPTAESKGSVSIDPHELYLRLANNAHDREAAYRALFSEHTDSRILNEIRRATNTGCVLGDARFRERIEALTGRQVQPKFRGGDRKSVKNLNHCYSIDTDPIDPFLLTPLISSKKPG